ncbi:energy transducer TonB [Flavobacterium psychrotrophum]|uniref:energy transducer TonB n=1 Tax=Flavobacterium psychrotrophum TaxID=2294119 RepID=UPI000E30E12A|nr:energy transducer TonB [Flavobacterium psychrotrophum]
MKYLLVIFFISISCFGQKDSIGCVLPIFPEPPKRDLSDPNAVYNPQETKTPAEYADGIKAFMDFLSKNIDTRKLQLPKDKKTRVYVSFIIEKDGNLSDIIVAPEPYKGLSAAVINAISKSPKWIVATNSEGAKVRMRYALPYTFKN